MNASATINLKAFDIFARYGYLKFISGNKRVIVRATLLRDYYGR